MVRTFVSVANLGFAVIVAVVTMFFRKMLPQVAHGVKRLK